MPPGDRHLRLTLLGQGLLDRAPRGSLVRVVRRLAAVQAQIPSSPLLALAARVQGLGRADVERELLTRKRLLRVFCLRLTLHVIAADDLPLFFAAVMRDGYEQVVRIMCRADGLTPREIRAGERAILRELARGPRTRSELRRAVPGFRPTFWGREIRGLAQQGLVVHAGRRGGEAVFDLRERWAPRAELGTLKAREARRELLLRYLDAYGSATPRDFAHWTGLRVRDVLPAFADARALLREEEEHMFVRRGGAGTPAGALPERLLPRYDPLLLGHKDKRRYLDPGDYRRIFRPAAVVEASVLARGRVAGTWSYDEPHAWRAFRPLSPAAAARLGHEARGVARLLAPPTAAGKRRGPASCGPPEERTGS